MIAVNIAVGDLISMLLLSVGAVGLWAYTRD